jgi:hypothetical protein
MSAGEFQPHQDKTRKREGASQSETPSITLRRDRVFVTGYTEYNIDFASKSVKLTGTYASKESMARKHVIDALARVRKENGGETPTWIDLGANTGSIVLKVLSEYPNAHVTMMESDIDCVSVLDAIRTTAEARDWSSVASIKVLCNRVSPDMTVHQKYDVVTAFALVHWLYSCTASFGSLDRIVDTLAGMTRRVLIIEWVEPSDGAIQAFKHTDFNRDTVRRDGPYTRDALMTALKARFREVKGPYTTRSTRSIYVAML